jgi:hypothetical protein
LIAQKLSTQSITGCDFRQIFFLDLLVDVFHLTQRFCFIVFRDIREAIDCVLSGRPVTVPQRPRYNFCAAT